MQLGSSQVAPEGHAMLAKLLYAGIEGHMADANAMSSLLTVDT